MTMNIKTQVKKEVDIFDKSFANAHFQSRSLTADKDKIEIEYKLYNDEDAAELCTACMAKPYVVETNAVTPHGGDVAALLAAISGRTNDEKLAALLNAAMDVCSDVEIAKVTSPLYGGSKV